jgi:hypothetical protein
MEQLKNKIGKNWQTDPLYQARIKNVLTYNKDNVKKVE